MWEVICVIQVVPEYYVQNMETGKRKGPFDCERWAQRFADTLNARAEEERSKKEEQNE